MIDTYAQSVLGLYISQAKQSKATHFYQIKKKREDEKGPKESCHSWIGVEFNMK